MHFIPRRSAALLPQQRASNVLMKFILQRSLIGFFGTGVVMLVTFGSWFAIPIPVFADSPQALLQLLPAGQTLSFYLTKSPEPTSLPPTLPIIGTESAGIQTNTHKTPPTIAINLSGQIGNNHWYVGNVTAKIAATTSDTDATITKIGYSLDTGRTFAPYTDPIVISENGKNTILARATDNFGNTVVSDPTIFQISQAAPEVGIMFDTGNKNFTFISQSPENSKVAMSQSDTDVTLQDEAGNTMILTYTIGHDVHQTDLTLKSLQYNHDEPKSVNATLSVIYAIDVATGQTTPVFQKLTIDGKKTVVSFYIDKQDQTIIENHAEDGSITNTAVQGITLLKLVSDHGTIQAVY